VKPPNADNLSIVENTMTWTKPEAEIVAVTMEVTAYVATL
jgi:coenzyme PQQ precursor peptide PqqA